MSDLLQLIDSNLLAVVALLEDFSRYSVCHLTFLSRCPQLSSMLVVMSEFTRPSEVLARHIRTSASPHGVVARPDGIHSMLRELFILSELSPSDEPRPGWSFGLLSKGFGSSLSLFRVRGHLRSHEEC